MSTTSQTPPRLEVRDIVKSFPGVKALKGVSLKVLPGEVLSVVGENGAGKSTLMKILAGVQAQDSGAVLVNGQSRSFRSVSDAMESGIALIHQELNLADNLEIGANIFLGREPRRFGIIHEAEIRRRAADLLQRIGLNLAPDTLVRDLTVGQQQMVEIAKALSINAQVLIMDEPTSSLSAGESVRLFEVIRDSASSIFPIDLPKCRIFRIASLSCGTARMPVIWSEARLLTAASSDSWSAGISLESSQESHTQPAKSPLKRATSSPQHGPDINSVSLFAPGKLLGSPDWLEPVVRKCFARFSVSMNQSAAQSRWPEKSFL